MFWISIVTLIFAALLIKLGFLILLVKIFGAALGMSLAVIFTIAALLGWRTYRNKRTIRIDR